MPDPALNPETAAAAAGISVRYANALLAEDGLSLERLIVRDASSAAVRHGRRHTSAPHDQRYRLRWGFSDLSHFTRRFKGASVAPPPTPPAASAGLLLDKSELGGSICSAFSAVFLTKPYASGQVTASIAAQFRAG